MLVLSRRTREQILLPDLNVKIEVICTKSNQVRLGISAPDSIRILRGELAFDGECELPVSARHASWTQTGGEVQVNLRS